LFFWLVAAEILHFQKYNNEAVMSGTINKNEQKLVREKSYDCFDGTLQTRRTEFLMNVEK
jgi:hypothetical protein